jgi:hypothetical protein
VIKGRGGNCEVVGHALGPPLQKGQIWRLSIWILCLLSLMSPRIVRAEPYPEPNPPVSFPTLPEKSPVSYRTLEAPTLEWTLHKTEDNLHPDDSEQQRVWLINRARANPTAEGVWLATTNISDIASGRSYFQVNVALLQSEFASYAAKPPAAFDRRLYDAAKEHSEWMIEVDDQSHGGTQDDYPEDTFQFNRIKAHGFNYNGARGNVFARAQSALNAHGALNIDWGSNADGMQTGRGHRQAIMAIDNTYSNVGIAMVEANVTTHVGPLVVTDNFCVANTGYLDHYNRFLVGTVWADLNGNAMYDPGEGIDSVTVMPDHGTYFAVTANSGGYAVPILSDGTYQVTFSGPSLPAVMKTANVGSVSVLLDLQLFEKGDINGDGNIDLTDVLVALQVISGLNPEGVDLENYASSGADVNGDRKIGWEEVVYIVQRVKGRRP